ncbi:MAG: hypothetical protein IJ085_03455, partial [Turicibacter sp.]|nr:hypothetical protein [Turicibacter sp.]
MRTTNGHDIKGWVQKLAQRSGIEHFNPGKNPGRLETIARAMGLNSMDHLAEADNISLFEFMFYQPRFGLKGNESFLESSKGTLDIHSKAFQQLPTLNHDNRGKTVIYANQSVYIPSQRFDFQQINGESQTHIDYAINRGEYYHLKDFRYLSRDEIAKIKDKQVAQGILDSLGTSNGLYMMKLGGASKYNEGKESVIFRNTLEDFEDVFKKFSLFKLVDDESQAGVGFDSVTQKMIDKQTKVTVHDKLRREITGYFSEGDRQYKSMRNMYLTFDAVEESFKNNGYQMTKSNVHKLIHDKLPGVKKEEIFNPIFTNTKVKTTPQQRYQAFEEMFSFIKSSRTTMGTVFDTIESNINPSSLKALFHTQSPLGNSSMDSFVDVMRTKALGSFMNHFELKSSTSSPRTMRDAFSLVLPKFDSTGKMLEETIRVNFFDVNSATSSLTNLVSGGRYQKTVGAEQTFKVGEVKQVLSYLSERGFISKKYVDEVYNNTNAYDVMKKVAYDIHHSFNNLYKEMGFGNVDLNSEQFQVNVMMEMLNQKQEKTFSSFGEGVYQQWMQHPDERWNLNVFSVALKDGANKTQQKARGFDSFVKRNHLDIQSMVLDSIQQAKQSNVKVLDR